MESFLIKGASGSLEFFDRHPLDPDQPIEEFWVRVSDVNLSASAMLYESGYAKTHPVQLFREMAERWRGWSGELDCESFEGEMRLSCSQDRTGHVSIVVELRSGSMEYDWSIKATVRVEAGQLEGIARGASSFFGWP